MRKRITLKFAGTCKACGAKLPAGSAADWYGKGVVYGLTCHGVKRTTVGRDLWEDDPDDVAAQDELYVRLRGTGEPIPSWLPY